MKINLTAKLLVLSICFSFMVMTSMALPIADEPTVQTFSFTTTPGSCSEIDLDFVKGDGSKRIIIASPSVPVSHLPEDGRGYSASSLFGSGSNLGDNNYVVYNASGSSVTVSGLDGGTEYYFAIFELNGNGNNSNYLLPGYLESHSIAPGFTMSVSSSSGDMCSGDSVELEVQGADDYLWAPSASLSSSSDSKVWAKPNVTTLYTIIGSDISGCLDTKTITITVYSSPSVLLGIFSDVCSNSPRVSLNSGTPAGGSYSGTGVSGSHFYPDDADVGRHIITYSYSDIHGCSSSDTSSILVSEAPTAAFTSLVPVCINTPVFALSGGTPEGGIYSGTGVSFGQFSPAIAGIGNHQITYTFTNAAGCSDDSKEDETVLALPIVSFATFQPVCLNVPAFNLTEGSPAGGIYSGTGVSNSQFSPLVSGAGTFILNYSYTDSFGCTSQDTSAITVHTLPSVNFASLNPVCQNTGPVVLNTGSPTGGTYSGTGVGNGIFYTGLAGAGQHAITYTYSNIYNCSNTAVQTMTVNPIPYPSLGPDILACSNTSTLLTAGSFSSYVWSTGARTQTINVDSTGRGLGKFPFSIIVTNSFGCVNKDTVYVTFDQCNGISNLTNPKEEFNIFPNPFSSMFTLHSKEGSDISIFDINGALILENKNAPSIFTYGETLSSGIYIVKVQNTFFTTYKLILKN